MRLSFTAGAISIVLLCGCVVGPTAEDLAEADYGPPPQDDYQDQIIRHFESMRFDVFDWRCEFSEPEKAWLNAGGSARSFRFGWRVVTKLIAFERFGGEVGQGMFYVAFFRDGGLLQVAEQKL